MQDATCDEARIDIVCKQGKSDDAKGVLDDRKRNDDGHNPQPSPYGAKKELPGYDTGNDERKCRPNAAAFLSNMNCQVWQSEHKTISKDRNAKEREHDVRDFGRTPLEKHDDRIEQAGWKWHHA